MREPGIVIPAVNIVGADESPAAGGKPAFIGLAGGSGESANAWHDFLTDLTGRGLTSPLLVISDGAPGLIAAIELAFPKALRQRCLIQRARNVLA